MIDESGLRLDRIAYDDAHRVFVAQLGPKELLATIEQPAARVGIALEAGLTSRMLEAVSGEPGRFRFCNIRWISCGCDENTER